MAEGTGLTNGKVIIVRPLLVESFRIVVRCWEISDHLAEIHRLADFQRFVILTFKKLPLFRVDTLILHVPRDVSLINSSGSHVR